RSIPLGTIGAVSTAFACYILLILGQATYGWLTLEGSVVPAYPVRLAWGDVLGTLAVVVLVGGLGSASMVRLLLRRLHTQA
ncbi:MAG: hypothetical protein ACPHSC_02850, partial [Flavobacteriales bacterium]